MDRTLTQMVALSRSEIREVKKAFCAALWSILTVQALDAGKIPNDNEGARAGSAAAQQRLVGVRDEETNHKQRHNIDERYTPDCALDSAGHGLARVRGLGSGETDKLGAGKGEGGGNKHTADAWSGDESLHRA